MTTPRQTDPDVQSLKVQVGQLRSSLEATMRLRLAAEHEYRKARKLMWDIARAVVPQRLDDALKADHTVDDWGLERIARWVAQVGQTEMRRLKAASRSDLAEKLAQARADVASLAQQVEDSKGVRDTLDAAQEEIGKLEATVAAQERELNTLQQDADTLNRSLADARSDNTALRSQLDRARGEADAWRRRLDETDRERGGETSPQPPPRPSLPPEPPAEAEETPPAADTEAEGHGDWLAEWQRKPTYEFEVEVLKAIGFRGLCLRASIEKSLARRGVISEGSYMVG